MTSKEKAIELVEKFMSYSYFSDGNNSMERGYQQEDNSKACALIAVDEIIESRPTEPSEHCYDCQEMICISTTYWQEVKNEINKL